MTTPEETRALMNLADLLSKDLSQVETEELVAGIRDAELTGSQAPTWSAELIRELRCRGVSWPQMAAMAELPQTTLWRRVNTKL